MASDSQKKLLQKAVRYLGRRPRSVWEIKRYLKKKLRFYQDLNSQDIDSIISQLKELELLGDQEFCQWWLEQRVTFKPKGKRALRYELLKKGINKPLIKKALKEFDEARVLKEFWQKKLKNKFCLPEEKQKLIGYLKRRGFSWQNIKQIIDQNHKKN